MASLSMKPAGETHTVIIDRLSFAEQLVLELYRKGKLSRAVVSDIGTDGRGFARLVQGIKQKLDAATVVQAVAIYVAQLERYRRQERERHKKLRSKMQKMAKTNWHCPYCGIDFLSNMSVFMGASLDHIQPRSKGGPNRERNRVYVCCGCNAVKGCSDANSIEEGKAVVQRKWHAFSDWLEEARAARDELHETCCEESEDSRPPRLPR